MTSNARLKAQSRRLLTYGYVFLMFATLVYGVFYLLVLGLGDLIIIPQTGAGDILAGLLVSVLLYALLTILQTGYCFMALNIVRAGNARIRDLFLGFRYHTGRLVLLSLFLSLIRYLCILPPVYVISELIFNGGKASLFGYTAGSVSAAILITAASVLVSLLLYVAVYLPFSQSLFVFIDNQDFRAVKCLAESFRLMRGKRIRFFLLNLSFIGYWFLVLISFGIANLCVKPYVEVTLAQYYVELSGRRDPYGN